MDKTKLKIFIGVIALLGLAIVLNLLDNPNETPILFEEPPVQDTDALNTIYVDLKGAVVNPGVYKLHEDTRMYQLIDQAGGFINNASVLNINMSQRLYDQMIIYIPSSNGQTEPPVFNDDNALISISTADQATLETLPNIGASTALNIINYRNEFGPFETIEDIINVTNIGPTTYENIKDLIRP